MIEYWESKFKSEGIMWEFEPSDSAIIAKDLFTEKGIKKILIPGVGYGRNASAFYSCGFDITGIEISQTAIDLAKKSGFDFPIHHGSVTGMPFDSTEYEGIFCYSMIHLLNKHERLKFLKACYNQLTAGGYMIFTIVSKNAQMYGSGRLLSKDRYELKRGLKVFFYDSDSVVDEFKDFGLVEFQEINEPIRFMKDAEPISMFIVKCKK